MGTGGDGDSHHHEDEKEELVQNVVVMRHGDRVDNFEPLWAATAPRPWDPPLIDSGMLRAYNTGRRLRNSLPFPIHRVFVSPFLRCVQTASEVVSALCALDDDPSRIASRDLPIDPSKVKVSIEYGLCEMMNRQAIRQQVAPRDGKFNFNISECEAMLPAGTVDQTAEKVYKELPKWEETISDARSRYEQVFSALADKFPLENILMVTHGEGVGVAASAFMKDIMVYEVEYCAYLHAKRQIKFGENQDFVAGDFEVLGHHQSGIRYSNSANTKDF